MSRTEKTWPNACAARPYWLANHVQVVPPRMLCVRRRKHGGKHADGRGHQWDQKGGK